MPGSLAHTFGPIMMYKWFNGNADLPTHILIIYVSSWLLEILVKLTLGLLSSILKLMGYQYHAR
jgi:hypothetical protein